MRHLDNSKALSGKRDALSTNDTLDKPGTGYFGLSCLYSHEDASLRRCLWYSNSGADKALPEPNLQYSVQSNQSQRYSLSKVIIKLRCNSLPYGYVCKVSGCGTYFCSNKTAATTPSLEPRPIRSSDSHTPDKGTRNPLTYRDKLDHLVGNIAGPTVSRCRC